MRDPVGSRRADAGGVGRDFTDVRRRALGWARFSSVTTPMPYSSANTAVGSSVGCGTGIGVARANGAASVHSGATATAEYAGVSTEAEFQRVQQPHRCHRRRGERVRPGNRPNPGAARRAASRVWNWLKLVVEGAWHYRTGPVVDRRSADGRDEADPATHLMELRAAVVALE